MSGSVERSGGDIENIRQELPQGNAIKEALCWEGCSHWWILKLSRKDPFSNSYKYRRSCCMRYHITVSLSNLLTQPETLVWGPGEVCANGPPCVCACVCVCVCVCVCASCEALRHYYFHSLM